MNNDRPPTPKSWKWLTRTNKPSLPGILMVELPDADPVYQHATQLALVQGSRFIIVGPIGHSKTHTQK